MGSHAEGHDHAHDHGHDHGRDHAHGDEHDHAAELRSSPRRRLVVALLLTSSFLVAEVIAGIISGSLALLSDAGHMLTDAAALGLALWAQTLGQRRRTGRKTFGYRRAEILAAAANGVVLGATAIVVMVEAVRRFGAPPAVQGRPMLVVASLGLVVNLASAWVLAGGRDHSLNMRAAAAHVLADAAGSVAAIVAALLILGPGWVLADPVISILISLLILYGAWQMLRDAIHVLMEGAPPEVDPHDLERIVRETPGVAGVHDLHVWSIADDVPVVTVHVLLAPGRHGVAVARDVGLRLEQALGAAHVTVQPEAADMGEKLVAPGTLVRPRG